MKNKNIEKIIVLIEHPPLKLNSEMLTLPYSPYEKDTIVYFTIKIYNDEIKESNCMGFKYFETRKDALNFKDGLILGLENSGHKVFYTTKKTDKLQRSYYT